MIQKDVNLKPYNTLGIESTAHTFIEVKEKKHLHEFAKKGGFNDGCPFILGGGSNILLKNAPSKPVIKISIPGIEVIREDDQLIWVKAGAGVVWHDLVTWAVENQYGGIENLALIPGMVGAAPIQNIGAYGVELEEVFQSLEYFDTQDLEFKTAGRNECRFGYRDSIFKAEWKGRAIVTSVTLRLRKPPHQTVSHYYALQQWLDEKNIESPSIMDIYSAVIAIRNSKLPDPSVIGNAGSFFKNPVIKKKLYDSVKKNYPGIPSFQADSGMVKVPAGWLIEQAGWKGKRVGNVGTYENQALVIVNHGGATGDEIFEHALRIQKSVKQIFGIELTPEVNIIE